MHPLPASIPSGIPALDEVLGCGGYPRGAIVEIFGPPACGKTTLALHAVAALQRSGGTAAFIDAEHALDAAWAAALDVELERLIVIRPSHGEEALEIAGRLLASSLVDMVVVDSAAALAPRQDFGLRADFSGHGRLLETGLRKLGPAAARAHACLFFINQLRLQYGPGAPESASGGSALKLAAAVRAEVERRDRGRAAVRIVKNRRAAAFRTAVFHLLPAVRTPSARAG